MDFCKGSATFANCGTTCPPSIVAIALRGEWSLGSTLEIYFRFSEQGGFTLVAESSVDLTQK